MVTIEINPIKEASIIPIYKLIILLSPVSNTSILLSDFTSFALSESVEVCDSSKLSESGLSAESTKSLCVPKTV